MQESSIRSGIRMISERARQPRHGWLHPAAMTLAIALGLFALARLGSAAAIYLPFSHIDGAFQTASGLFRLQEGQLPGRDFFPYLGVGVVLGIFPLFLLYGGDFAASIAGAHLAVALAQALALTVILYLTGGGRRFLPALAFGILAVAAALLWSDPPALLAERLTPGNSLRPLRSALPYVAVLVVYQALARNGPGMFTALGLCAGLAMIWSNDFALPTAFGCALVALYRFYHQRSLRLWASGSAFFLVGFGAGLIPLLLATAGHLPALLGFNFIDVAGDQWWYYGPWDEQARLFRVTDVHRLLTVETSAALLVLVAVGFMGLRRQDPALLALAWLGGILLLGGALASVGGHLGGYFSPFHFWALLSAVALLCSLFARQLRRHWSLARPTNALNTGLLIGASVLAVAATAQRDAVREQARQDPLHFRVPELGGYLNRDWQPYIQFIRQTGPDDSVFEEYWGIWSAMRRPEPLLPVDSVIHALGRLRRQGLAMVEAQPDWIVTTLPHGWQTWSLSANYWLYRGLLEHYSPVMTSPATVLWRREPQPVEWVELACSIASSGDRVQVEALQRGYYELRLSHQPVPAGRRVTLLRTDVPDAFHGWAALQPETTETLMPGFAPLAGPHEHPAVVLPRGEEATLQLTGCQALQMSRQDPHLFASAPAAYPFSDETWAQGFARELPLVRVLETLDNRRQLAPGAAIRIDGETPRTILDSRSFPPWLDLRFEGDPIVVSGQSAPIRFDFTPAPEPPALPPARPGERRPF